MASLNIPDVNPLPPGWDCKYDNITGKRYYINYFTRHTSMEDPRVQLNESIPLQEFSSNEANHRLGLMMGTNSLKRQQSAVVDNKQVTTDQAVAKISVMFPTVSETHIRTLLLKYHNREAVVMSALQVEKHPLTTPGPYTPPMGARPLPGVGLYAVTPRASPLPPRLAQGSPRPHSSPKMKLRYLKSVFPVVEETMLLDTLSSSDNNVHRATQTLQSLGFDKRATPPPRVCLQRQPPTQESLQSIPLHPPPPRMKSVEEKQEMKVRLREKHPNIAERVVSIALDSVDYDETKADQILSMAEENPGGSDNKDVLKISDRQEETNEIIVEEPSQPSSPESPPGSPSGKRNQNKNGKHVARSMDDSDVNRYCSSLTRTPVGPNPNLPRGPNQGLLLPDYVAWCGSGGLARGPDPRHREGPTPPRGPDPSLRKGPHAGLARGSIYSQLAALALAESRGK